jgi:hypothetical protein
LVLITLTVNKDFNKEKYIEMKINSLIIFLLSGVILLSSCGKPTTPESLNDSKYTGGYKIVKKFQTPGYSQDVIVEGNLLYMAQGEGGLLIVDVADPANPQIVSVTTDGVRGYSSKIEKKDTIVYLAAGSFGLSVLNVTDPAVPVVTVSNLNMKPAKDLHIMGDYLFTAVSEQGIRIAEISIPGQPDIRGGIYSTGYAHGIAHTTDSLLLVASGEMGLTVYNLSNFQNGYGIYPQVGWCDTPGYAEAVTINEDQKTAFVACGTSGLQIINYADTNNIRIVGSFDEGGYAKELVLKNDLLYLTVELGGLQIIDVSTVTDPYLVGTIETEFSLGVDVDNDHVYVADEDEGLIIIEIPK